MSNIYIAGANRPVDTGDSYFGEISKLPIAARSAALNKLSRSHLHNLQILEGEKLKARIEYARYIVDCPNCHNAEFVFEDELFLCSACQNSDVGGAIRRVKLPPERKQIEDILGKRKIINRHWFVGETVDSLSEEVG